MNPTIDQKIEAIVDRVRLLSSQGLTKVGLRKEIKSLLAEVEREARIEENKNWLTVLLPAGDENVVTNSDFNYRIAQLTKERKLDGE